MSTESLRVVGDVTADPWLITLRRQEAVIKDSIGAIDETLAFIHKSRTNAHVALVEVQTAIQIREIELGVSWFYCDCGAKTMNQEGCVRCLEADRAGA